MKVVVQAKWEAWNAVTELSPEDAMLHYSQLVESQVVAPAEGGNTR